MSFGSDRRSLETVFAALDCERRLPEHWRDTLDTRLGGSGDVSPWYVRAMVGFGAWLAALLLMLFVAALDAIATGGGFLVLGFAFMGGGLALRRVYDNDFVRQLTLALSLAGQGLFVFAVVDSLDLDNAFESALAVLAAINLAMIVVFPDKTHRFVSTVLVIGCLCGLLYAFELADALPFVGPALVGLLIVLDRREASFASFGLLGALSAVRAGVLVGAFGCLLLSTVYLLPELGADFAFYPRPWISTLLFGALLLYFERGLVDLIFASAGLAQRLAVGGLSFVVVLAALPAPGLILALLAMLLGCIHGHVLYRRAGIVFVVVFTGAYFYGMEVGMLVKSASLIATGVVVLACRWLLAGALRSRSSASVAQVSFAAGAADDPSRKTTDA